MDYSKIKRQVISKVEDNGNFIILHTQNFTFCVDKDSMVQHKEFVQYPYFIDFKMFDFGKYQIYERTKVLGKRTNEYQVFLYFPNINYSLVGYLDILWNHYFENDNKYKNVFDINTHTLFIVNLIREISSIDEVINSIDDLINILSKCVTKSVNTMFSTAAFKPNDYHKLFNVKLNNGKIVISDNFNYRQFELTPNKLFYEDDIK